MQLIAPSEVVAEARTWIDVPYLHQGRNRLGVDCVGLTIVVGRKLKLFDYDEFWYARQPDGRRMEAECDRIFGKPLGTTYEAAVPGSIGLLWMANRGYPQHLVIFAPYGRRDLSIVHAYGKFEAVKEHRFDNIRQRQVCKVYGFPGVGYV